MMRICARCVTPTTRPGIELDADGVCLPCRYADRDKAIDWKARWAELQALAQWGRDHRSHGYDCIVPVSGGKDSMRQALVARDDLGLRPLLVSCAYPPEQQSDEGAHNISNLVRLGFDTIVVGPAPETWKALMKRAFFKFGNWAKATELALYASPVRVAIAYKIPLVFLGENNALTYGDIGGSLSGSANRVKYNNTLAGGDPKELIGEGITYNDVNWHIYPTDEEMERAGIQVVYMGYYLRDFTIYRNAEIAIANGLRTRSDPPEDVGALSSFEDLDENFVHVNQLLKFLKLGFSRVTDECSQAIRYGMMTRDEAVRLVRQYDGKCADRFVAAFADYIGIGVDEFWRVANRFRNPKIWRKTDDGKWVLLSPIHLSKEQFSQYSTMPETRA